MKVSQLEPVYKEKTNDQSRLSEPSLNKYLSSLVGKPELKWLKQCRATGPVMAGVSSQVAAGA